MSFDERVRSLETIRHMTESAIFGSWIEAGRSEQDLVKQQAIGTILQHALQEDMTDPGTIREFQSFINDNSNATSQRVRLIQVLGRAATKETLDLLLQSATATGNGVLKKTTIAAVAAVGGLRDDGRFHEELSPALERTWSSSEDRDLLSSTSVSIAKVGAPDGVKLLLASALATDSKADFRARIAEAALLSATMNPHSIPVVSAALLTETTGNARSRIASGTLARIGKPAAIKVLIKWFQNADDSAGVLVGNCIRKVNNEAELQLWESALDSKVQFRSEKNRQAIRAALVDHRQRGA